MQQQGTVVPRHDLIDNVACQAIPRRQVIKTPFSGFHIAQPNAVEASAFRADKQFPGMFRKTHDGIAAERMAIPCFALMQGDLSVSPFQQTDCGSGEQGAIRTFQQPPYIHPFCAGYLLKNTVFPLP